MSVVHIVLDAKCQTTWEDCLSIFHYQSPSLADAMTVRSCTTPEISPSSADIKTAGQDPNALDPFRGVVEVESNQACDNLESRGSNFKVKGKQCTIF